MGRALMAEGTAIAQPDGGELVMLNPLYSFVDRPHH